jgi:hypothetical protein
MPSLSDVYKEIEELSGLEVASLPLLLVATWLPRTSAVEGMALLQNASGSQDVLAAMKPTMFVLGQPSPLRSRVFDSEKKARLSSELTVFAIFEDDAEFRIYALPTSESGGETPPPTRFRLCKTAAVYSIAAMNIEVFKAEIADEWTAVAEGVAMGDDEEEPNEEPTGDPEEPIEPDMLKDAAEAKSLPATSVVS